MRQVTCSRCQATLSMGAAYSLGTRVFCEPCAMQEAADSASAGGAAPSVVALTDPTICARCGTDWGGVELPRVAGMPFCASCVDAARSRPFPSWLPRSLAALAFLAALSLWHHQRYLSAYLELVRAQRALGHQDVVAAAREFEAAAGHVPEDEGLAATGAFFRGLSLLQAERAQEAVPLLARAQRVFPRAQGIEAALREAEAGVAFDAHDYAVFLEKQKAIAAMVPNDPMAQAGVASALACQYAVAGDEGLKTAALDQLGQASRLVKGDRARFEEYEARIRHRLETREILSREQYLRRFPERRR